MRRLILLFAALMLSMPAMAQGGPEIEALADALFAKDLKTVLQHLPPEFEKAYATAPIQKQRMMAERLMLLRSLEREGLKLTRPDSGPVVLVVEPPVHEQRMENERLEILLDKRMSDGNETMLRFRMNRPNEEEYSRRNSVTLWMRYVDGSWRIYEIDAQGDTIKLDDPKFLAELTDSATSRPAANEASAVGSLRTLNTAAVTYAATYPEVGYPQAISQLAMGNNNESTSDHAGLIDDVLGSGEKSGYRFTYERTSISTYRITGRPIEFGTTGTRSFFTDESGVIRFTSDDREPAVDDKPLQ